ncbi:MAG: amidohydrolase family protein [Ktedonobacteraceae bacterium]
MSIDVHAHLYPPKYMSFVNTLAHDTSPAAEAIQATIHDPLITQVPAFQNALDERIVMMDKADIDIQILSLAGYNIWHPDPVVRSDIVRVFNDSCTEAIKSYSDRFLLFANVPLPFVDKAIAEAARAFDELGAVGIGVCTHFAGLPIDHAQFEPFYQFMDERKGIISFHPDGFTVPHFLDDYGMEWGVGALFDDTIVLIRLIYSGLLERFPNITWLVPHLAGTLPFLIDRLDDMWRWFPPSRGNLSQPPSSYLRHNNLYIDTITTQCSALILAREIFGADRLVLGSDFPYVSREDLSLGTRLLQEANFSSSEIEQVLSSNIASKLGLSTRAIRKNTNDSSM